MSRILLLWCLIGPTWVSGHAKPPGDAAGSAPTVEALANEREKLREDLETLDRRTTHLEQSVIIMMTAVGVMIAVLAGTTFLSDRNFHKAVKDMMKEADDVRRSYPKLAAMEKQAKEALSSIESTFGTKVQHEWLEDIYETVPIEDRQKTLTMEHLIALEFGGRSTVPQLRGMANFYYSKYKAENLKSDLDRSLYYAQLAAERGNDAFQYLNDLGYINAELGDTRDRTYTKTADVNFRGSMTKEPKQQRCYYNLAGILYGQASPLRYGDSRGEFVQKMSVIRGLLEKALGQSNWEASPNPELASLVHYNLACCLCLIQEAIAGHTDKKETLLDKAVKHLHIASDHKQTKVQTLEDDLDGKKDENGKRDGRGDLSALANNAHYSKEVEKLRRAVAKWG